MTEPSVTEEAEAGKSAACRARRPLISSSAFLIVGAMLFVVLFFYMLAAGDNLLAIYTMALLCVIACIKSFEGRQSFKRTEDPQPAHAEEAHTHFTFSSAILGVVLLIIVVSVFSVFVSNFGGRQSRSWGKLTACKSNLKNIGTALEMYSTDNKGRYPHALSQITPNYLKTIPTCPGAGASTYAYTFSIKPDAYTVFCSGSNHKTCGTNPDYPEYDTYQGLIEH